MSISIKFSISIVIKWLIIIIIIMLILNNYYSYKIGFFPMCVLAFDSKNQQNRQEQKKLLNSAKLEFSNTKAQVL